jgi:hypothetical protein
MGLNYSQLNFSSTILTPLDMYEIPVKPAFLDMYEIPVKPALRQA